MKLTSILLFVTVFANSLFSQSSNNLLNKYFPFNENVKMFYESNTGDAVKSVVQKDSLFLITNASSKFTYTQSLMNKEDGIYLVKTEQNIDILFYSKDIEITYSEPILQLPTPLIVGDSWNWSGFQVKNGDTTSVSIKGEVLEEVVVNVPAGKFNTIKIKIYFEEVDGEKTTIIKWLAPDIGSVKTNVIIEGSGIIQVAMSLLGYDEINSELKEIYRQ